MIKICAFIIISLYPFILFSKPIINSKTKYYYIYPDSKDDLRRALFAKTPILIDGKKFLGVTRWKIHLEYETLIQNNTCKASNLKSIANILIILPKISKEQKASYNTKSSFRIFYNKVKKHEHKHEYYIIRAAKEIDKKISKIKPQSDCKKLKKKFDKVLEKVIKKYNKKNKLFDKETKEGHNPKSDLDSYF